MQDIGIFRAFLAGFASFLSPCVLPLVPGYLSILSGVSIEEITRGGAAGVRHVLGHAFLFVLGFSLTFTAMGAAATTVGAFLQERIYWFHKIAGLMVIFFGLHLMGVFRLRFLMAERRYQGRTGRGHVGTFLMGMAFAFGWSPCIGPILFSILAYASTKATVWQGIVLLSAYSAGIGVPFLIVGAGVGTFIRLLDRYQRHLRWVEAGSGALLVIIGTLMVTGSFEKLAGAISKWLQ